MFKEDKYFLIRKVIREEVSKILSEPEEIIISEDFRYLYNKHSFIPSIDIVRNVQSAMNVVSKNNLISKSSNNNEGSGLEKAKSLINRESISHSQLKRMKAFFDNNENVVKQEKSKGKNINTSGIIQSWNLWGGDIGRNWVEHHIEATNSSNKTSKKVRRNGEKGIGLTKNLMSTTNTRIRK